MNWDEWPKCAVPACHNKCCLRLRSIYCWPHTPGTAEEARRSVLEEERAALFKALGDRARLRSPSI